MKITRRVAQHINLVVATRRAERDAAKAKLDYDKLFDGLIQAVHQNV